MHKFLIIIEKAGSNYSAYSPDLPGCIATGNTLKQAEKNMHTAIEMHIEGMREDSVSIPRSKAVAEYVIMK